MLTVSTKNEASLLFSTLKRNVARVEHIIQTLSKYSYSMKNDNIGYSLEQHQGKVNDNFHFRELFLQET